MCLHTTQLTKLTAETQFSKEKTNNVIWVVLNTSYPDSNQGTFLCWLFRIYKCARSGGPGRNQATEPIQMISACSKVCKTVISSAIPSFVHVLRSHSSQEARTQDRNFDH